MGEHAPVWDGTPENLMMTGGYGNEETMAGHAGRGLHADWEHGDDGDGGE